MSTIAKLGDRTVRWVEETGGLIRMAGMTQVGLLGGLFRLRGLRLLMRQMFLVGTCSLPVVMVTGAFVGMVLAAQSVRQFQILGLEGQLGAIVNLSVLRELGPVLAGVLLAGRVGCAIAAELGTMRVTEQIDALRSMGSDPIRELVVPRYLACLLLSPFLVLYADLLGVIGGYFVSVYGFGVDAAQYMRYARNAVEFYDIFLGLFKSVFFGGSMALICCHKAFRCKPGAAGVGQACTEAFVASCIVILGLDFVLNVVLNEIYIAIWGLRISLI